jgi:PTS system nitrogen regulatory IIA component
LKIFSEGDVSLAVSLRNKKSLLAALATEAASRIDRPPQEILDALDAREELGSTGLGKGVALPHAQLPGSFDPVVLFWRLTKPIDFDARDGEPVDLVFLVIWPAEDAGGILTAVSGICRALRDAGLPRQLRLASGREKVVELMREHSVAPPSSPTLRGG